MSEPCEFEIELLEAMTGRRPAFPWGAAVGAALEFLKSSGLVARGVDGVYCVTEAGLAKLNAAPRA